LYEKDKSQVILQNLHMYIESCHISVNMIFGGGTL